MEYINIRYPTDLSEINPTDDNIDVIVTTEDNNSYVLVVATPQNLVSLMKKDNLSFLPAGCPFAIVKELTIENIEELIRSFCEDDGYWLKYYHYAGETN